jgi:RNA polymerase sigma-70 factor (ECF subfamily)
VTGPLPEQDLILAYRETIRPLYAYVSRRVGGDFNLAEDLVQETWMRALDDWQAKERPDDPLAWLRRVAHNLLVSHYRRIKDQALDPSVMDLADERSWPSTPDAAAVVGWAMARLRLVHAEILEDFYFDEKPVQQIAAERGLSERAVEGRLRRARAKLRDKIEHMPSRPADSRLRTAGGGTEHERQTRTR